jgi:hypothetical protein
VNFVRVVVSLQPPSGDEGSETSSTTHQRSSSSDIATIAAAGCFMTVVVFIDAVAFATVVTVYCYRESQNEMLPAAPVDCCWIVCSIFNHHGQTAAREIREDDDDGVLVLL